MKRIMLVEDDAELANSIIYALKTHDFEADHVATIAEAYENYRDASLILLDVMLPDGLGTDLCRRLRAESQVPIIFLTARDEEKHIIEGLDSGGDDYITKPFRLNVLISRINAALRRCGNQGDEPELTGTETKLLTYLQANAGMTLTRNQILDYLWDSKGEFVDDNTLSVHISRLREKLEDGGKIKTVRGVGYKWVK